MNIKYLNRLRKLCGYQMPRMGKFLAHPLMRRLPNSFDAELFPGIHCTFCPRDEIQLQAYWLGKRFEPETQSLLKKWGSRGTHFFDIGANFGFYSTLLAANFPNLKIYAFEPNPATFARLDKTVVRNDLQNTHPQQYGLADKAGTLEFYENLEDSGSSSFGRDPDRSTRLIGEVDVIPFDTWRQHLELPATPSWFCKIDVEGFEPSVLTGMQETLASGAIFGITIEVCPHHLAFNGFTKEQVYALLEPHGYTADKPVASIKDDDCLNVVFTKP